ncbi:uncharacterized protein LOC107608127 [Arachis ipaensis]|uniref:uncharacterized protein LOC107608127 n=1 Tax=Arachis ipaensis TaxID=130454 RepID=UPI000A2B1E33|nr:uncharacterized protein LOC107608127 [Arachis ipaensis]
MKPQKFIFSLEPSRTLKAKAPSASSSRSNLALVACLCRGAARLSLARYCSLVSGAVLLASSSRTQPWSWCSSPLSVAVLLASSSRIQPWSWCSSPLSVAVLLACLCRGAARLIFSNPPLVVVLLASLCRGAPRLSLSRCYSPHLLEPSPGCGAPRLSLSRFCSASSSRTQPWSWSCSLFSIAVLLSLIFSNPAVVVVLLASLCVVVLLSLIFSNPTLVVVLLASPPASSIKYPPCYKDISFWINESFIENNLCELVRGIAEDLVEETDTKCC